jgi:hypothetical protein
MTTHHISAAVKSTTIAAFLLAALATTLHAQVAGESNWDNLRQLKPGQTVRVVLDNAQSHKGKFSSVSDLAVSLTDDKEELAFNRADVLRVSTLDDGKRRRNMLIGLGIGAGAGLAAGVGTFAAFGSTGSPNHAAVGLGAMGAGVGAGVGAGLGGLSGFRTVYRADTNGGSN